MIKLQRDEKTKALLNNDAESLNKYKMERNRERRLKKMEEDISFLKKQLKQLLEDR